MSGYLLDGALMMFQAMLENHIRLHKSHSSGEVSRFVQILDEVNAALSGESLVNVVANRIEEELKETDEILKCFHPGPQKGPSSSAKIQAEQKATINELNEPFHNGIDEFVCDCLEFDPDCSVSIAEVYDAWNNWCKGKRVTNLNIQPFVRQLKIRHFVMARRFSNSQPTSLDLVGMRLKAV